MNQPANRIVKAEIVPEIVAIEISVEGEWLQGEGKKWPHPILIGLEGRRLENGWVSSPFPFEDPAPWPIVPVTLPLMPGETRQYQGRGITDPVVLALGKMRWLAEMYFHERRGPTMRGVLLPIPTEAEAKAFNEKWTGIWRSPSNQELFDEWFLLRKPPQAAV